MSSWSVPQLTGLACPCLWVSRLKHLGQCSDHGQVANLGDRHAHFLSFHLFPTHVFWSAVNQTAWSSDGAMDHGHVRLCEDMIGGTQKGEATRAWLFHFLFL